MATAASDDEPPLKRRRSNSFSFLPPDMSELRVVLLGSSWTERKEVGNLIVGGTVFSEAPKHCLTARTRIKDKDITVINTPLLPSLSSTQQKLTEFIKHCVRLSAPGPHVFLLVLQPEDFTEEHKLRLCRVLESYSDRSFAHSLILISIPREEKSGFIEKYMQDPPLKDMIRMCRYRYLLHKKLELPELLTRLGQIATEKNGEHVSYDGLEGVDPGLTMTVMPAPECRPSLNLVLCGRRGAGKTSAEKGTSGIRKPKDQQEKNEMQQRMTEETNSEDETERKKEEIITDLEHLKNSHEQQIHHPKVSWKNRCVIC